MIRMAMLRMVEGGPDLDPLASIAVIVLAFAVFTALIWWSRHRRTRRVLP